MKNKPYVKEFNAIGECTNPITKEHPYLNSSSSNRGNNKKLYVIIFNVITNAVMGKMKAHGNNRASTCKNSDGCKCRKHKNSRLNQRF